MRQLLDELIGAWNALQEDAVASLARSAPNQIPIPSEAFDDLVQGQQFQSWYGGSVLNDSQGRPRVWYHGTSQQFSQFSDVYLNKNTRISTNYIGFYFTSSPENAKVYTAKSWDPKKGMRPGATLKAVFLRAKKPKYINERTYWKWSRRTGKETVDQLEIWRALGFDAVIMPSVWKGSGKGSVDCVVFESSQIHPLAEFRLN